METGIRLTRAKRRLSSAKITRADIERRLVRPESFAPPRRMVRAGGISVSQLAGIPVYRVGAPERAGSSRAAVLFLHGGGYTAEISPRHWRFVRDIAHHGRAEVVVPIYPLAPLSSAAQTVPWVGEVLDDLCERKGAERVVVMGDSAGGGLSVAVAQLRRANGRAQPARLVLISPWLDASLSDPRHAEIEPRDAMLGRAGLSESARLYAGELKVTDPRVSPLFGEVYDLAPSDVFTGTADLLNPDAHRWVDKCVGVGVQSRLHEAEDMPHDYPLMPLLPAGAAARRLAASIVAEVGGGGAQ